MGPFPEQHGGPYLALNSNSARHPPLRQRANPHPTLGDLTTRMFGAVHLARKQNGHGRASSFALALKAELYCRSSLPGVCISAKISKATASSASAPSLVLGALACSCIDADPPFLEPKRRRNDMLGYFCGSTWPRISPSG